jgi:hypothetical protein
MTQHAITAGNSGIILGVDKRLKHLILWVNFEAYFASTVSAKIMDSATLRPETAQAKSLSILLFFSNVSATRCRLSGWRWLSICIRRKGLSPMRNEPSHRRKGQFSKIVTGLGDARGENDETRGCV